MVLRRKSNTNVCFRGMGGQQIIHMIYLNKKKLKMFSYKILLRKEKHYIYILKFERFAISLHSASKRGIFTNFNVKCGW